MLWPWRGALLAGAVALLWAALFAALRRPGVAAAGVGLGVAAGWLLTLGAPVASARQLPERLPLLAVAAAVAGAVLAAFGPRRWTAAVAAIGVVGGAWWLGGAPLYPADVARNGVVLLGLAVLGALLLLGLSGAVAHVTAAGLLVAGLWLTRPVGPWLLLGWAVLAAGLGGLVAARGWPAGARLAPALALAALLAGPVVSRGGSADWAAAAAPVAALWLGPALAGRLGGRAGLVVGWALAGGVPLLFTWLLLRAR